jgi:hypothetical protein
MIYTSTEPVELLDLKQRRGFAKSRTSDNYSGNRATLRIQIS